MTAKKQNKSSILERTYKITRMESDLRSPLKFDFLKRCFHADKLLNRPVQGLFT